MLTPPTDSLYKFLAISGLVVLAWGVTFPAQQESEYYVKVAELKAEIASVKVVNEVTKSEVIRIEREQERAREGSDIWNLLDREKQKFHVELMKAAGQIPIQQAKLEMLLEQKAKFRLLGWIGTAVGASCSLIGFGLWYFRVQKYLDEGLKSGNVKGG